MACILYSLIGIPITLLALKSAGELIKDGLSKLIRNIETRLLKREEVTNCKKKCVAASFLLTVTMMCIGAGLTVFTEKWSFLEGVYFWFVSFSTIGFGDYVLRNIESYGMEAQGALERAGIEVSLTVVYTLWYFLGLCSVSGIIVALQDIFEKVRCPGCCPGIFRRSHKITRTNSEDKQEENVVTLGIIRIGTVRR